MQEIYQVHPRLRQRRRSVGFRKNAIFEADRQALICALRRAIRCLEGATDAAPGHHVRMTIALYRWALGELEGSVGEQPADISFIRSVCTLLDNASQNLLQAVSAGHCGTAKVEKEN